MQIDAPRLDARQVEQIVDDGLQPLAVFARGEQQVGLLFASAGPTASSVHRWIAMRSDVSGVRNSCATVATRLFFSSSKRSSRVMSWNTTAAPATSPVSP